MAEATRSSSELEDEPRHRRVAPVLIMAVTLVGGVLALVDARVSDHASVYGDAARQKLVQALGEREQATASLVLEDQAETAAAMDATLATGPTGVSDVALASLLSSLGVADASSARVVSKYSRLGLGSAVLEDGTAASVLFQTQQVREFKRTREYQEADEQTSEEFASKSADVETAITILAVALFLLGLSLTVPAAKARHVLTATGMAIAAVAGAWGIAVAIHPVPLPSGRAISAFLEGDGDVTVALNVPGRGSPALLHTAVDQLDTAISLRPRYASARLDRSLALEQLAQDYSLPPHASEQALADLQAAISYGGDSDVYEADLSDDAFWLGRYGEAISAARRAVALDPESLPAAFNQAQYLELGPRPDPEAAAAAVRLLARDYANTPNLQRTANYQGIAVEIGRVFKYRPALAAHARAWRKRLTRLLGPVPR
jgi:hypothetical protein